VDCIVLPTVSGPAPTAETTGDASFQSPFSLLGLPSISIPSGSSPDGLPLGLQLAGHAFEEASLISVASWCERELGPMPAPPDFR
jgi:Asp-tRNA(Asn)/Glu-tRNA(Gln) amidotransferase A subunit family amidase